MIGLVNLLPWFLATSTALKSYGERKIDEFGDTIDTIKNILIALTIGFIVYQISVLVLRVLELKKK